MYTPGRQIQALPFHNGRKRAGRLLPHAMPPVNANAKETIGTDGLTSLDKTNKKPWQVDDARHLNRANFTYLGGHVKTLTTETMKNNAKELFCPYQSGRNQFIGGI